MYAATVRCVDELHAWLKQQGFEAERYHGRMSKAARVEAQNRFMSGECRVMVATSAFGMRLSEAGQPAPMRLLAQTSGLSPRRVSALEDIEFIERSSRGVALNGRLRSEHLKNLFGSFEAQHQAERDRLQAMIRYCESLSCRTQYLREYFGEASGENCDHCDNCKRPAADVHIPPPQRQRTSAPSIDPVTFSPGCRVKHRSFGHGEVVRAEDQQIIVRFARHGVKRILASKLGVL